MDCDFEAAPYAALTTNYLAQAAHVSPTNSTSAAWYLLLPENKQVGTYLFRLFVLCLADPAGIVLCFSLVDCDG